MKKLNIKSEQEFTNEPNQTFNSAIDGDQKALNSLVENFYPLVQKYAETYFRRYRFGYFYEDSSDIAQNVMMRFQKIIQNYAESPYETPFIIFLKRCIRNVAIDMAKKSLKRQKTHSYSGQTLHDFNALIGNENVESGNEYSADSSQSKLSTLQSQDFRKYDQLEANLVEVRIQLIEFQKRHPDSAKIIYNYYWLGDNDTETAKKNPQTRNQVWRERQKALSNLSEFI